MQSASSTPAASPLGAPGYGAFLSPRIFALVLTAMFPMSTAVIFLTGLWVLGRLALRTLFVVLKLVWPGTSLKKYGAKKGAWAVVTGATDGLGREFALQLAQRGFHIMLVSRNPDKLARVAAEVEAQAPGMQTRVHSIDFAKADDAAYAGLETALDAIPDIGVLVNNVGVNHMPTAFADVPAEDIAAIVAVNAGATVRVTRMVLPRMRAARRGLVLALGSFSGNLLPTPMLATYAGSKEFVAAWARALARELAGSGVDVRVLSAWFIMTPMSGFRRPSMLVPSARAWVRAALGSLGVARGVVGQEVTSVPYWSHALVYYTVRTLGIVGLATSIGHRNAIKAREKLLRRLAKNQ